MTETQEKERDFMKTILIILSILLFSFPCLADERSELELKKQMLMERQGRLIAEFEVAKRDLISIEAQIQKLNTEAQGKEKVK